jgi:hypothetical protein
MNQKVKTTLQKVLRAKKLKEEKLRRETAPKTAPVSDYKILATIYLDENDPTIE